MGGLADYVDGGAADGTSGGTDTDALLAIIPCVGHVGSARGLLTEEVGYNDAAGGTL
jgi:hypothetical protein